MKAVAKLKILKETLKLKTNKECELPRSLLSSPGVLCFENHMALNLIDATREFYIPDMRPYTIYHICI